MDFNKLNVKDLRNLIRSRNLKIPTKGSGKNGSVLKDDLISLLNTERDIRKSKKYKTYNMQELKNELNDLGVETYMLKGSGLNGRILKRDLLSLIEEKTFKREKAKEGVFINKVPPDILRTMLIDMNLNDVLNTCRINKYFKNTVCNEFFWNLYAKKNISDLSYRKDYKTWKDFVITEKLKYKPDTFDFVLRNIKKGKWSKAKAEEYISDNFETMMYDNDRIYLRGLADDEREIEREKAEEYGGNEVQVGYYDTAYEFDQFIIVYSIKTDKFFRIDGFRTYTDDQIVVYDSEWDNNLTSPF